jgi:hypothetical protein
MSWCIEPSGNEKYGSKYGSKYASVGLDSNPGNMAKELIQYSQEAKYGAVFRETTEIWRQILWRRIWSGSILRVMGLIIISTPFPRMYYDDNDFATLRGVSSTYIQHLHINE